MADFPLDIAAWISLGVLALGMLAMLPVWWSNYRGWYLTPTPQEMRMRELAFTLTVGGMLGLFGTGMAAAQRNLSPTGLIIVCVVFCAALLVIAFGVDAAKARRRH